MAQRLYLSIFFSSIVTLLSGCNTSTQYSQKPIAPSLKAREPVIALALGGGGAKGFAHIGVIKVLEAHGIKAQIVTGTSAGSFVGSIYASGKTATQMQALAYQLKESDIRDLTISRQGFIIGQKLQDYINTQVGNKPIEQFPIRFSAIATQLNNGQKTAFIRGNAGQAVRASCSIPNVFIPTTIQHTQYVDGGLVSPIPVKTAQDMGADLIIAVDISARPSTSQQSTSSLWGLLDQTINIMGQQSIQEELKHANIIITPQVGQLGVMDLSSARTAIMAGEKAALQQTDAIDTAIAAFKKSPAAFEPPPKAKF